MTDLIDNTFARVLDLLRSASLEDAMFRAARFVLRNAPDLMMLALFVALVLFCEFSFSCPSLLQPGRRFLRRAAQFFGREVRRG